MTITAEPTMKETSQLASGVSREMDCLIIGRPINGLTKTKEMISWLRDYFCSNSLIDNRHLFAAWKSLVLTHHIEKSDRNPMTCIKSMVYMRGILEDIIDSPNSYVSRRKTLIGEMREFWLKFSEECQKEE